MDNEKKSWETPQLIILARGTPEERVLAHCKAIHVSGGSLLQKQDNCAAGDVTNCSVCWDRGGGAS